MIILYIIIVFFIAGVYQIYEDKKNKEFYEISPLLWDLNDLD